MLDFGFLDDIKEIKQIMTEHAQARTAQESEVIGKMQTCLFSATFPKEIKQIANEFLVDPYHV